MPCDRIQERRDPDHDRRFGASSDDPLCYKLTTGAGQTATLKILEGSNTAFSIDDLIDDQDDYSFTTEKKTYKILVFQTLANPSPEKFEMSVVVK